MAEFAYNNIKNASTGHIPFELNCGYYLWITYEEDVDPHSQFKLADELSAELRELIIVCQENLHHAHELQKRAYDKGVKSWSYAPSKKIWLNSKYIKTKCKRKLEAKFFGPFRIFHPIGKQVYKLELPKKWRIHDVFHVSLLNQDTTRKGRVDDDENNAAELDAGDESGEYKVEAIWDSAVYARESKSGYLPSLYYLVSWKRSEEKNTKEPASMVQHLRKLISLFHKDHLDKSKATSSAIDTAPLIARPTVKLPAKQKQEQLTRHAKKRAKWGDKKEATRKRRQGRGDKEESEFWPSPLSSKSFII